MEKISQRMMEKQLQKALAIEYVRNNYKQNEISVDKLKMQKFILSCNECAFAQPSSVKPQGLINDNNN